MKAQEVNAADGALAMGFVIAFGLVGFFFYFLPTFIAVMRGHQNWPAIMVLNVFLGWTFIGFVAALVWSFTEVKSRRHHHYHQHVHAPYQQSPGQPPIIDPNRNPFDFG